MQTLLYERGARGGQAGGLMMREQSAFDVVDLAKRMIRDGAPVLDDPLLRDELVDFLIEIQGNVLARQRLAVEPLNQDRPQGLALSQKLRTTELVRRINEFAVTLTGTAGAYYVDDPNAIDDGIWTRGYLNSFSATIGGGTSQIQRNIVGEHVLGLPKDGG